MLGIQIAVEKVTAALAAFQSASIKTLVKEERSFGFWSPRRCDVYVVSYHPGYLQDRLEVVAYLWKHNISADLMYESGLPDGEHENHLDICAREGILCVIQWFRGPISLSDCFIAGLLFILAHELGETCLLSR